MIFEILASQNASSTKVKPGQRAYQTRARVVTGEHMYECTEETREEVEIVRLPLRLNPSAPGGTVAPLPQPPIDGIKNATRSVKRRGDVPLRRKGRRRGPPRQVGGAALRGGSGRRRSGRVARLPAGKEEGRWDFTRKLNRRRQTMGGRRIEV